MEDIWKDLQQTLTPTDPLSIPQWIMVEQDTRVISIIFLAKNWNASHKPFCP